MGKHIDIILSNPPYKMGNEITRAIVDNVDFDVFINLMPCSCYKAKNLFKDVNYIEPAEDDFVDATVGKSITIAVLEKGAARYDNFDELENCKRDPQFQEYYTLNAKATLKTTYKCSSDFMDGNDEETYNKAKSKLLEYWENHDKKFCITWRAVQNGTHSVENAKAFDVLWNIKKEINWDELPICCNVKNKITSITVDFITFNTAEECTNFTKFFYAGGKSGLMNKLVKGLNKTSGSIDTAIPNINWSKSDRDYEHATLEDVMNWLREDNNL